MTEYQRVNLNEASATKNMANESPDSPSALNYTIGFSKTGGNQEKELAGSRRNFWQRRSKMEKYLLAILIVLLLLVLILFIFSVILVHDTDKHCTTPACVKVAANILNSLDETVDPCKDFYQYACGGWMKSNPLPENQHILSKNTKLTDDNEIILKYVLEDESFELKGEAEKKARIMYRSCMNTSRMDKKGSQPLLGLLKKRLWLYWAYMTKVGVLFGGEENATRLQMQDVIQFKMKLAEIQLPVEELKEHNKLYRKLTVSQLQAEAPFLNWRLYFNSAFKAVGREIDSSEPVMVLGLDYLKNLSELVTQYLSNVQGRVTIANYLAWLLVHSKLDKLSKPFRDVKAALNSGGGKRWKKCVSEVENSVGFALSAMFVREAFPGDSKIMAQNMIQGIKESFKENFPSLKWMDPEAQKLSADKVDSMIDMIGYPEYLLDPDQLDKQYEALEFNETDYFQNVMNTMRYDRVHALENLDLPTDRTDWFTFATTINAHYDATANVITFTAAILQPPFYDASFPNTLIGKKTILWCVGSQRLNIIRGTFR